MYWLVYDTKTWQPEMDDVRSLLKSDKPMQMRRANDDGPRHPFYALWFGMYGLRAMNAGLVITEQKKLPGGLPPYEGGPFTHGFGYLDDEAVNEALMRLHDNKLFVGIMNDALDIHQNALGLRQKLGMMGQLNRWSSDLEILGDVTERLMDAGRTAQEVSHDWVVGPLNKIFGAI